MCFDQAFKTLYIQSISQRTRKIIPQLRCRKNEKERSLKVTLLFLGANRSRSLDDLRLYLENVFNTKSFEIYSGARPGIALKVKKRILNWIL